MSSQIPLVDYFSLRGKPHPTANECINCGARFFGRRNACANCFGTEFNTLADPKNIALGMKVTLATYSMGKDDHGFEAIGFGFEPAA